jgi:adenylate cyclase
MNSATKAIFISYASQDVDIARRIGDVLRNAGLEVWFDQSELRGGDAWDASIRKQIKECALFIPVISQNTQDRREGYFRLEWKIADDRTHLMARGTPFLMPVTVDATTQQVALVPDSFLQVHWTNLSRGDIPVDFVRQVERSITSAKVPSAVTPPVASPVSTAVTAPRSVGEAPRGSRRIAICVLPFMNMSGDTEQEYFSDGISEDIITDLSKVSALWVAARNTTFTFKGKHVDIVQVARQLNVSYVLEGSVRKAGSRVRITAQLIDGVTGGHVWAERYDRNLDDIFALQDEISQAIVAALKLKLLPEEKKAIEQRGTNNAEAYKLYLMARQYFIMGNAGTAKDSEATVRLCRRATEIDPDYAHAWSLMAGAQSRLRMMLNRHGDGGLEAADRALSLDPNLAEAHAAKARILVNEGRREEARWEIEAALRLDPESYEVSNAAATYNYSIRHFHEAIPFFEKAATDMPTDFYNSGMLVSCYRALGDSEGARRAATRAVVRTVDAVTREPDNGSAMGFLVGALAALGEVERTKEWIERANLLDPDNRNMRYNFACALIADLRELEAGLDLLASNMESIGADSINWIKIDPDLDLVRDHPRFKAMLAKAEERIANSA